MATLVTIKGPNVGRQFTLDGKPTLVGRQTDANICLESQAVSRHHARFDFKEGQYFVEDLHSSNGTWVNGKQVRQQVQLADGDTIQIGPYFFSVKFTPTPRPTEHDFIIRGQVTANPSHYTLLGHEPAQKLKVVLEIAQHLARTLDRERLLGKLLDHLMHLFPQADRGMVLLVDGDHLEVRAHRCRKEQDAAVFQYSRTVVQRALQERVGILSDDVGSDQRFSGVMTLTSLNLRSLLCVPLVCQDGTTLGVIQLDCSQAGRNFKMEDLELLTAVGLQVAVVLQNADLHSELLREERLRQELVLAHDIQQGYLPKEFPSAEEGPYEIYARVSAAREVSGDLYDFFTLKDGRLAFFVGDVSGKGIPAALFMVAVRTLGRHLAGGNLGPAETLRLLNASLSAENVSGMFVTLVHGWYDPATGDVQLASAGHPLPLLRRADGQTEVVAVKNGRLLGYDIGDLGLKDHSFSVAPGETLVLYTDGLTEAHSAEAKLMFGQDRVQDVLKEPAPSLEALADRIEEAVLQFTGLDHFQDDLTLFLLRRK